jgi:hypothetical protein
VLFDGGLNLRLAGRDLQRTVVQLVVVRAVLGLLGGTEPLGLGGVGLQGFTAPSLARRLGLVIQPEPAAPPMESPAPGP